MPFRNSLVKDKSASVEKSSQTLNYDAPGKVNDLTQELKVLWNNMIESEYNNLAAYHSRFFNLNFENITDGVDVSAVRWAADPAEPNFCFNEDVAQKLSDWRLDSGHPVHGALSTKGRRETHNEYCEYRIHFAQDEEGKIRPKRVTFTTELREYWMLLAEHSPEQLLIACEDAIGRRPNWDELYGSGVNDPDTLSPEERKILFATWVSGASGIRELLNIGVPNHPIGTINNLNALFMTHQINGLDDLLYIVLYGAHPYAKKENDIWVKATKDEIFSKSHFDEQTPPIQLACRHADPAAALGAAGQAFEGKEISFANPLGMYILGFAKDDFLFNGNPIPSDWIQFKRGDGHVHQRLEFGPPDDSPYFLDEITVGDEDEPLKGGFQVAKRIEVGPLLRIGSASTVTDEEYQAFEVETLSDRYNCAQAGVCTRLRRLKDEYDDRQDREV